MPTRNGIKDGRIGSPGLLTKSSRRRRSSSLMYAEPPESLEQLTDQSALPNINANWVNAKGMFFLAKYYGDLIRCQGPIADI